MLRRKKKQTVHPAVRRKIGALISTHVRVEKRLQEVEQDCRNLAQAFIGFAKIIHAHCHYDNDVERDDFTTSMPLFDEEEAEKQWQENFP
jgi:hypothetical protein